MTDNPFPPPDSERVSLLPIHPSCGHRLASLGCKAHHRGLGEPVPDPPDTAALRRALVDSMVSDGELELVGRRADGHAWVRLTAKGKRRAEQLLGLPAGCLDDSEDYEDPAE